MRRIRPYPTLKHWRDAEGLNQRRAAERIGVSQTYYSRLERNVQAPCPQLAKRIMHETGVPLEAILGIAS